MFHLLRLFILIASVLGSLYPANSIVLAQAPAAQNTEDRERGIQLYRANSFVQAAKVLKASVKNNSTDELAWHYLGLALAQQPKELKNASKAFETAIKLRPDFAAASATALRTSHNSHPFKVHSIPVCLLHEHRHKKSRRRSHHQR